MATNTLGYFNPAYYANEVLMLLENALGLAGRVHRGFERERNAFGKGDLVNIRTPSTFVSQDSGSAAQNLDTGSTQIQLSRHKEVLFEITDKDLTLTGQQMIDIHLQPAAYAIANEIDYFLADLFSEVPWYFDLNASPGSVVGDITGPHQVLFDNGVPMSDEANLHFMTNGAMQANLLGLPAFAQWQGSADRGVATQQKGVLGQRYGFNFFANQNTRSHTAGTCNDTALQVLGAWTKGSSTISLDAVDGGVTGTLTRGDTFVIAGNSQRYSVTATATAASNQFVNVAISPPLVQDYADNAAVTVRLDTHVMNAAFHRNFAALCVAPLTEAPRELGAKVFTAVNQKSQMGIRARMWYTGYKTMVGLDVLYGAKILNPNMAVRACG